MDLVKIFLYHLGDVGVKMTGSPGGTRTASGARGAGGSCRGDRGKRPVVIPKVKVSFTAYFVKL